MLKTVIYEFSLFVSSLSQQSSLFWRLKTFHQNKAGLYIVYSMYIMSALNLLYKQTNRPIDGSLENF